MDTLDEKLMLDALTNQRSHSGKRSAAFTPNQAMKAVDWKILMVFAASVVLGVAIQKTGIRTRVLGVNEHQDLSMKVRKCKQS